MGGVIVISHFCTPNNNILPGVYLLYESPKHAFLPSAPLMGKVSVCVGGRGGGGWVVFFWG